MGLAHQLRSSLLPWWSRLSFASLKAMGTRTTPVPKLLGIPRKRSGMPRVGGSAAQPLTRIVTPFARLEIEPTTRLPCRRSWVRGRGFESHIRSEKSCKWSRRVVRAVNDLLQVASSGRKSIEGRSGSDGTRTRDLERDRRVLVFTGRYAEV